MGHLILIRHCITFPGAPMLQELPSLVPSPHSHSTRDWKYLLLGVEVRLSRGKEDREPDIRPGIPPNTSGLESNPYSLCFKEPKKEPLLGHGLRILRRSGGPERLMSTGQASGVIYRCLKNGTLFSSGGGLRTLVEESTADEGYVVLLLA